MAVPTALAAQAPDDGPAYAYGSQDIGPGASSVDVVVGAYVETNGLPGLQRWWTCADGSPAEHDDPAPDVHFSCDDGSQPTRPDERVCPLNRCQLSEIHLRQ